MHHYHLYQFQNLTYLCLEIPFLLRSLCHWINILKPKNSFDQLDLLIIVPIQNKGWILDGIAKEISLKFQQPSSIVYVSNESADLPKAKNILFMHHSLLFTFLKSGSIDFADSYISCWFTHASPSLSAFNSQYVSCFNRIHKVIFTCRDNYKYWTGLGLDEEKACVALGGFDTNLFRPHIRNPSQSVGICSSFYERKNPILLLEVLKLLLQYHFSFVRPQLEKLSLFEYMMQLGNLSYISIPYKDYPHYYSKMDVFFSPSTLEGGPIPVLEAMGSNCYPVTSKTGFCSDLITHSENGLLFDAEAEPNEVADLIITAKSLPHVNIAKTVQQFSWTTFVDFLEANVFV